MIISVIIYLMDLFDNFFSKKHHKKNKYKHNNTNIIDRLLNFDLVNSSSTDNNDSDDSNDSTDSNDSNNSNSSNLSNNDIEKMNDYDENIKKEINKHIKKESINICQCSSPNICGLCLESICNEKSQKIHVSVINITLLKNTNDEYDNNTLNDNFEFLSNKILKFYKSINNPSTNFEMDLKDFNDKYQLLVNFYDQLYRQKYNQRIQNMYNPIIPSLNKYLNNNIIQPSILQYYKCQLPIISNKDFALLQMQSNDIADLLIEYLLWDMFKIKITYNNAITYFKQQVSRDYKRITLDLYKINQYKFMCNDNDCELLNYYKKCIDKYYFKYISYHDYKIALHCMIYHPIIISC